MYAIRSYYGPARDPGAQLQSRAGDGDARQARELHVQRLVEAAASAAHFEVGVTRERAHRRGKLFHCGTVHQVHAKAERDAERNADDRKQRAHTLVREACIEYE